MLRRVHPPNPIQVPITVMGSALLESVYSESVFPNPRQKINIRTNLTIWYSKSTFVDHSSLGVAVTRCLGRVVGDQSSLSNSRVHFSLLCVDYQRWSHCVSRCDYAGVRSASPWRSICLRTSSIAVVIFRTMPIAECVVVVVITNQRWWQRNRVNLRRSIATPNTPTLFK